MSRDQHAGQNPKRKMGNEFFESVNSLDIYEQS